jgi:hypothetical protein
MAASENGGAPREVAPHDATAPDEAALDEARRPPHRFPTALVASGVLVLLIAVGAAAAGPLHFGGPRWVPPAAPPATPPVQSAQPRPTPTPTKPSVPHVGSVPDLLWLAILIGALALAFVIFLVTRWLLSRRRDRTEAVAAPLDDLVDLGDMPLDPSVETGLPYLRRGLRRALIVLDENRDPSDAIIQAWLGLQESAEDAGFQRFGAETPTEFTTRILRRLDVDASSLDTLRRLYLAVRFGDAVATVDDVAKARRALETLEAQWTRTGQEENDDEPGSGPAHEVGPTPDGPRS